MNQRSSSILLFCLTIFISVLVNIITSNPVFTGIAKDNLPAVLIFLIPAVIFGIVLTLRSQPPPTSAGQSTANPALSVLLHIASVVAFNIIILCVLVMMFLRLDRSPCIPTLNSALIWALSILLPFHVFIHVLKVIWPNLLSHPINSFITAMHPWNWSIRAIVGYSIICFAVIYLITLPPVLSYGLVEKGPEIENFNATFEDETSKTFYPRDTLAVEVDQWIRIETRIVNDQDPECTWRSINGELRGASGCATGYKSLSVGYDAVTVSALSICKTQMTTDSLFIISR